MTDEQINKAIAEACGWKFIPEYCHGEDQPPEFTTITPDGKHLCGYYPDYVDDLNAMHKAEKVLTAGSWKEVIHATNRYTNELCKVLGCLDTALFQFAHATAAQRAEAFLKTLNLWEQ